MNTILSPTTAASTGLTEENFRNGVMPRAQLSIQASQLAVEKATQSNAKEFAGFELEEAIAVVKVLTDAGTMAPRIPSTNTSRSANASTAKSATDTVFSNSSPANS